MKTLAVLLALAAPLAADTVLDFSSTNEGFTNTAEPGGAATRATDTGGGSLRLTNPAGWKWRANSSFSKAAGGKPGQIAAALGSAAQTGGTLRFDLILRPATAATGRSGGFWGVQYNVAINQKIPGVTDGWSQVTALSLPANAFPPAAETTIPVSVPLMNWSATGTGLKLHPDSPYYEINFGSNAAAVSQVEWHIDNLRVEIPPPVPGPIMLEAENAALTGVVVSNQVAGFSGSGYATGFDQPGDRITWNFQGLAGFHQLTVRFRTPSGPKGFDGTLNGGGFSGFLAMSSTFADYDAGLVELVAGSNTLTLGGGWNYYDIDFVTLTPQLPSPPPSPGPCVPVDAAATFRTKALLAEIGANYGLTTYSGQQDDTELPTIQAASGKLPAVFSGDLIEYSPTRVARTGLPGGYTESLVGKAAAGHILSIMWHWNAPSHLLDTAEQPWWKGFYAAGTTFDLAATLANPSGADHALLLSDIDAIAVQLKKLDAANIPILWRPLHEPEYGGFWWGASGANAYKQLWRLLYDRLTVQHGLHNLIWVLSSEDPAWFPGNDVVDVVGVDGYPTDRTDALVSRWLPLRARFDGVKPLALSEFGGVPDIEKMQRLGVWWSWFCSWTGTNGPSSEPVATISRIYQSPAVVTLDELPPDNPDANGDGVLDTEAIALGFDPGLDLGPAISFFRGNAERFQIGHSDAEIAAATEAGRQEILADPAANGLFTAAQMQDLALGHPLLQRDSTSGLFTLRLRLTASENLTGWQGLAPDSAAIQPDGSLDLKLPASGGVQFYRVQGEAP